MKSLLCLPFALLLVFCFACAQPVLNEDVAEYQDLLVENSKIINELQSLNSDLADENAQKKSEIDILQSLNSDLADENAQKKSEIDILLKNDVGNHSHSNQKLTDIVRALEFLRLEEEMIVNMIETNALQPFLEKGIGGMTVMETETFLQWAQYSELQSKKQDDVLDLIKNSDVADALILYKAISDGESVSPELMAKGVNSGFNTGDLVDLASQDVNYLVNLYSALIRSAE